MKKATTLLSFAAFSTLLVLTAPAMAQTTDSNTTETTTTQTDHEDDDDHGNWGLLGLLGLAGLLGRRKREEVVHHTNTGNQNRPVA